MATTFTYPYRVLRVIDGDTVVVQADMGFHTFREVHVRVSGVNTPEVSGVSKAAGEMVKGYTARWLAKYQDDTVLCSKEIDKFGRVLGDFEWCIRKTIIPADLPKYLSLSSALLAHKLAKPYDGGTRKPYNQTEITALLQQKVVLP